jgi:hypothetical protein
MLAVRILPLLLFCFSAHADLYRWVDPESGSVKLSSTPPPWFERDSSGPAVERIPYTPPAARGRQAEPNADSPAALRARWREAMRAAASQPSRERIEALQALTRELDRADPNGASQRRAELADFVARLQPR